MAQKNLLHLEGKQPVRPVLSFDTNPTWQGPPSPMPELYLGGSSQDAGRGSG